MPGRHYTYRRGPGQAGENPTTGSVLAGNLVYAKATGAPRRRTARATLDAAKSEAEFQAEVCRLAELHGWTWWHDTDARRNAAGLPDLLLIRERVVWAELKKQGERLSGAQKAFHARLKVAGAEVYVFQPSSWDFIVETLIRRGTRTEAALGEAGRS